MVGPIQIVVACDDSYAQHLSVLLLSIFDTCVACPVQIHVLISERFAHRDRLAEVVGDRIASLSFIVMIDDELSTLSTAGGITIEAYYRLLIGNVLPNEVSRAIYLDCDMVVRNDLVGLWAVELEEKIIGAVDDQGFTSRSVLGLADDAPYFNSGVLLIDLDHWRRERIGSIALEFAASEPQRLTYHDQCALNWVLRDRWHRLDPVWNVQAMRFGSYVDRDFRYFRPAPDDARTARIVHFNAPAKPWLIMCDHPLKEEYITYLRRTPWRDCRPLDRYPHNIIRKLLLRRAPVLLPFYKALRRHV